MRAVLICWHCGRQSMMQFDHKRMQMFDQTPKSLNQFGADRSSWFSLRTDQFVDLIWIDGPAGMPPLITHPSVACRLVSRAAFLEQAASLGTRYDKLVVGVAIIHPFLSTTEPLRVLIVQRAAHEKFLPGVYELPGGSVLGPRIAHVHATLIDLLVMSKNRIYQFSMVPQEKSWRRRDWLWRRL